MTRHVVTVNSWAGRREVPVRIIGETPKRYKLELLLTGTDRASTAGRGRGGVRAQGRGARCRQAGR